MPIVYPQVQAAAPSPAVGYKFNYGVKLLDQDGLSVGNAYTASIDPSLSSWILFPSASQASGTVIPVQLPTGSLVSFEAGTGLLPAIEFWRLDYEGDVEIKLVTQTGSVVFGGPFAASSSEELILPTGSYTNLTQLDVGGDTIYYIVLEQSQIK